MTHGSYLLIEPGMTVQGTGGEIIGTVTELVADENADIFRGIVLNLADARGRHSIVFVPGEHITAVDPDRVLTDLTPETASQMNAVTDTPPTPTL